MDIVELKNEALAAWGDARKPLAGITGIEREDSEVAAILTNLSFSELVEYMPRFVGVTPLGFLNLEYGIYLSGAYIVYGAVEWFSCRENQVYDPLATDFFGFFHNRGTSAKEIYEIAGPLRAGLLSIFLSYLVEDQVRFKVPDKYKTGLNQFFISFEELQIDADLK